MECDRFGTEKLGSSIFFMCVQISGEQSRAVTFCQAKTEPNRLSVFI